MPVGKKNQDSFEAKEDKKKNQLKRNGNTNQTFLEQKQSEKQHAKFNERLRELSERPKNEIHDKCMLKKKQKQKNRRTNPLLNQTQTTSQPENAKELSKP